MEQLSGCWRTTCEDTVSAKTDQLPALAPAFCVGAIFSMSLQTAYAVVLSAALAPPHALTRARVLETAFL
jgi:hypothetical protein